MHTLHDLAAMYAAAKSAETAATEHRRRIAAQIQELTGHDSEGQKTYDADGWKITVKAPLIWMMDWGKWETVKVGIPSELWPVEMKPSLDEKGAKWLQSEREDLYRVLSQALTVKPGAVQISVKTAEREIA